MDDMEEAVALSGAAAAAARPSKKKAGRPAKNPPPPKKLPKPSDFKDHPFALAINAGVEKWTKVPGCATESNLGGAWVAVLDYYFAGKANHPLALAIMATLQTGLAVGLVYTLGTGTGDGAAQPA